MAGVSISLLALLAGRRACSQCWQAPPLYHTSGEVFEVVSTPDLERMARFMAFFVKQVDIATKEQIGTVSESYEQDSN